MRRVKRLIPVLLVAAIGLAYWEYLRRSLHASVCYCVEARFDTAPPDDTELSRWLRSQPGTVPSSVRVGREGADRKVLRVMFIRTPNLAGNPPFPDLAGGCRALGYAGREFVFRDSTDRHITYMTSE